MPQIGQFIRTPAGYSGRVRTLSFDVELCLVAVDGDVVEQAPSYRVHLGDEDGPEVGAGWNHTGPTAGAFVSIVLDDPVFTQPIRARLFQSDGDGREWGLHWSRRAPRAGKD
jgi:uncharacterized protein (DUF736 family)